MRALTIFLSVAALAGASAGSASTEADLGGVAAEAPATGAVAAATVIGTAEATWGGRRLRCRQDQIVALVPATEPVSAEIARAFGNTERGSFPTSDIVAYPFAGEPNLVENARTTRCSVYGRFRFTDVAPGTYYLTTTLAPVGTGTFFAAPSRRFSEPRHQAVSVMRRVQVSDSRTYDVKLSEA